MNVRYDNRRAFEHFDLYFHLSALRIRGQVIGYVGLVISPCLIETSDALQILAKSDWIETAFRFPKQIPRPNFGKQLPQDLTVGELCISGDLDFFDPPLSCRIQLLELNA